ncbi:MAG TPA: MFS transporter [Verrucomicrobiae bacterium]|nr:MFS transporter [Verrucomicrobiae bacterium]
MSRIFYGWWIVAVAALGLFLGAAPIVVYSFSVFLAPLAREFHSNRAAISFAFTLFGLSGALGALFLGRLVDRFGARKIAIPSLAIFAAVLLLNGLFFGKIGYLYVFYFLLGLVGIGTSPLAYADVISHWFDRLRGLALGLMMFGMGVAAIIMPPLLQRIIARFGWRDAYRFYAVAVLLVAVPLLILFLKERPESMGLLPDGDTTPRAVHKNHADQGIAWREASRDPAFWSMIAAFCLVMAGLQGCLVHLPSMLLDRGSGVQTGALAASCIGAALLVGRVCTGYFLDRFFAPYVAAVLFGQAALGMLVLALHGPAWLPFASAISVGLGIGAEADVMAYLVSRYFGLRSFAEIYSYAWVGFVISVAIGPYLMGLGFDRTGSYRLPLLAFVFPALAAAILIGRLGPYRFGPQRPASAAMEAQAEVGNP